MIGVRDLSVRFGSILALNGVSLDVAPGSIHALAGENGSGKSTLLKVLGGAQEPTAGTIVLNGEPAAFRDPARAAASGVGLIFQELSLFPHLSGYSNIAIGREPIRFGLLSRRRMRAEAETLVRELGFPRPDFARAVSTLSVAEQQIVEVLKCLAKRPRIILFDEPTASLTQREARPVLAIMKRLRDQGYTVVFVSHFMEEVFEVADRITVLRDGRVTLDAPMVGMERQRIVSAMLGRPLGEFYPSREPSPGAVRLALDGARCRGIEPVSLELRAGEILGVAGAIGSGASALGEMIGGIRPLVAGAMRLDGRDFAPRDAAAAVHAGVGYVPEDRRTEALLLDLSVATNMSLPLIAARGSNLVGRGGFVRRREERALVAGEMRRMGVRPTDPALPARALSGGNQQKVVLGRWFLHDRPIIVLNNPTKGVDVGAKADIYRHVSDLAADGHAVVLISNYNPELLGTADRIVVFREGQIVTRYRRGEADEDALLHATLGDVAPTQRIEEAS